MRQAVYTLLFILALLFSGYSHALCADSTETDITKEYRLLTANKLSISGVFYLELVQGDSYKLEVLTKPSVMEAFKFRTSRDRLTITPGRCKNDLISYRLTVIHLDEMDLQGSFTINTPLPLETENLELDISGDVRGHIRAKTSLIDISTTGDVLLEVSGETDHLQLAVLGNGSIDAARLKARTANLNIWGNGIETVNVWEFLKVLARGSTLVQYYGHPLLDQTIRNNAYIRALDE
ncbi:GIN domain-containing protein [Gynuella sunshinyii]|uniref:Putative auto-transporter adhesin head GIN domain-containing protein n=1 Tax=Gynuella sunshinyii YC6258 TaxID=1445510 RepID=A0A0C5VSJ8_9GAMM|nr:DUF2807 domain-containing protein [Gynuella sunshinyii]AJQ96293.1 hypothetical Protein YC6258_04259 [Gynuella sunshinyii YC6258]